MVNQYCAHSFARNWQLPFLNQQKGENDRRKHFIIKSPRKNVANPAGVESAISWSPVGRASNWATEAGLRLGNQSWKDNGLSVLPLWSIISKHWRFGHNFACLSMTLTTCYTLLYLVRQTWANSIDPDETARHKCDVSSGSTLFATHPVILD